MFRIANDAVCAPEGWAEVTLPPDMVSDGSVLYPVLFYP